MTEGDGRESDTQHNNDYLYSDAPAPGSPNASNVRAYTRQYQYDKIGNVQQVKQLGTNGFTRNFVYNTGVNTLQKIEDGSSVNIQSFTYDDVGNQITAGTTRNYVWNAANELITYYNQAGSSDPTIFAQYNYSGGNRVSKMVRTGSAGSPIYERVIYINGIFEHHILENGTTYEKNYVHIMDDQSRIAMVRIGDQFPDDITNAVTYNLEDQIGSSTVRLNTTGGVIDKEEYYPFGDSSLRTFSKKRYRYVGKEKDLESGLYYYGARYYAAWTCRFVSVDPLAAKYPNYCSYSFCGNKVISNVELEGLEDIHFMNTIGKDISKEILQTALGTTVGKDKIEQFQNKKNDSKYTNKGYDTYITLMSVQKFNSANPSHDANAVTVATIKFEYIYKKEKGNLITVGEALKTALKNDDDNEIKNIIASFIVKSNREEISEAFLEHKEMLLQSIENGRKGFLVVGLNREDYNVSKENKDMKRFDSLVISFVHELFHNIKTAAETGSRQEEDHIEYKSDETKLKQELNERGMHEK